MEAEQVSSLGPYWQAVATAVMAVAIGLYGAYRYLRPADAEASSPPAEIAQWRMMGAAFNDSQAINSVASELKEIRHLIERRDDRDRADAEEMREILRDGIKAMDALRRAIAKNAAGHAPKRSSHTQAT